MNAIFLFFLILATHITCFSDGLYDIADALISRDTAIPKSALLVGQAKDLYLHKICKTEPLPFGRGREAAVYQINDAPNTALKVCKGKIWRDNPKIFLRSTYMLAYMKSRLVDFPDLIDFIDVSAVIDIGQGWMRKQFFPDSVELSHSLLSENPEVALAYTNALAIFESKDYKSDPFVQLFFRRLQEKSQNIHWNPTSKKLVLIDAF